MSPDGLHAVKEHSSVSVVSASPRDEGTWPADMDILVAWQILPYRVLGDIKCHHLMISAMKIIP